MEETKANPPEPNNSYDPGFIISFWDRVIGDSYSCVLKDYFKQLGLTMIFSMMAWYHMNEAKENPMKPKFSSKNYQQAAKFYLQAAEGYSKDDEKHISKSINLTLRYGL